MLMCVLRLRCSGVAADVRSAFALLPLYGVRLVTDIFCFVLDSQFQSDSQ